MSNQWRDPLKSLCLVELTKEKGFLKQDYQSPLCRRCRGRMPMMQGQHFHLTQRNFYRWLLYKLFSYIWRISSDQNDTCRYCVFVKCFQHFKEKIKPCQFLGCFSLYWSITTLSIYVMVPPYWLVFCQPTNIGNSKSVKRCCSSPMQELEKEAYYVYSYIFGHF